MHATTDALDGSTNTASGCYSKTTEATCASPCSWTDEKDYDLTGWATLTDS